MEQVTIGPELLRLFARETGYRFTPHDLEHNVIYFVCPSAKFLTDVLKGKIVDYSRVVVSPRHRREIHSDLVKSQLVRRQSDEITVVIGFKQDDQTDTWLCAGNFVLKV